MSVHVRVGVVRQIREAAAMPVNMLGFKIALSFIMLSLITCCSQEGSKHMREPQNNLPASERDIHPLLVGSAIPDLRLRDSDGNTFDLKGAIAKKPTVLIFYRGGW